MTKDEYLDFCRSFAGAETDCPFRSKYEITIARHSGNQKWFAALMLVNGKYLVNLKCAPDEADFLRKIYTGITPGYHMNKVHWNSVYFDSDVPDDELMRMTLSSFNLTK